MDTVKLFAIAEAGATWKKKGKKGFALCPYCGAKLLVKSTQGQIRYCKCSNASCVANLINATIKAS